MDKKEQAKPTQTHKTDAKKQTEGKPFGDTILGKFCMGLLGILFLGGSYLFWVNSSYNSGDLLTGILGEDFRYPFETKSHYCSRISDLIFSIDTEKKQECLAEEE